MMHPDTIRTMTWILRAGGQVTPSLLAYWRFPYRGGDREARRRLSTFEERGWMKRQGTERYPLFTLTHEGHAMAMAAGIEVQCEVSRNPRPTAKHDAATAAILERAKDLWTFTRWYAGGEFDLARNADDYGLKRPDALVELRLGEGKVALAAIETELSKKGGTLKRGRSNWASTASQVHDRLNDPLSVLIEGEKRQLRWTFFICLDDTMAKGINTKLAEAEVPSDQRYWLVGNRLSMRVLRDPGAVKLELMTLPRPTYEDEEIIPGM